MAYQNGLTKHSKQEKLDIAIVGGGLVIKKFKKHVFKNKKEMAMNNLDICHVHQQKMIRIISHKKVHF